MNRRFFMGILAGSSQMKLRNSTQVEKLNRDWGLDKHLFDIDGLKLHLTHKGKIVHACKRSITEFGFSSSNTLNITWYIEPPAIPPVAEGE